MLKGFKNTASWLQLAFPKFKGYELNVEAAARLYFEEENIPRAKQTPSLQQQHTWADGSFTARAKHFYPFLMSASPRSLMSPTLLFLIHVLFLIFSDLVSISPFSLAISLPFHPSFFLLLQLPGIITGVSSEDARISRCLPLKNKCVSEKLALEATMQDRTEWNIAGRFVPSLPEHHLALIKLPIRSRGAPQSPKCQGS